ncbi:MAG: hypothetical protein HND48_19875 [Chloroflexi bacterium]|nr:hypothetical protein [Chloroflexota bacterium]
MDFTLAFVLACVFVGLSKGGLIGPIGGTLALPLLVQATYNGAAITVQGATGVLLALLMIGDVFAIPAFWRAWDWRYLRYAARRGGRCGAPGRGCSSRSTRPRSSTSSAWSRCC